MEQLGATLSCTTHVMQSGPGLCSGCCALLKPCGRACAIWCTTQQQDVVQTPWWRAFVQLQHLLQPSLSRTRTRLLSLHTHVCVLCSNSAIKAGDLVRLQQRSQERQAADSSGTLQRGRWGGMSRICCWLSPQALAGHAAASRQAQHRMQSTWLRAAFQ